MKPLDLPFEEPTVLPPAARHVAHAIQEEGPLRFSEIVELTAMPRRTARWSLDRLMEEDLVQALPDGENKRYKEYYWNNE